LDTVRKCIELAPSEEALISVIKRMDLDPSKKALTLIVEWIEWAAEVKISQKCFQLRLADSENFQAHNSNPKS
jgi:hypothetical protein